MRASCKLNGVSDALPLCESTPPYTLLNIKFWRENMEKKFIFVLALILSVVLFLVVHFNEDVLKEKIGEISPPNKSLTIKEYFNGDIVTIEISYEKYMKLYEILSNTKYRRKNKYIGEMQESFYEVYFDDIRSVPVLVVDEDSIAIFNDDYTKYTSKKDELLELISFLEGLVETRNKESNTINRADYIYLETLKASELTIVDLLKRVNINYEEIILDTIRTSISNKGSIESLHISFYDTNFLYKSLLKYNRKGNVLEISNIPVSSEKMKYSTSNKAIFDSLDFLMKETVSLKDNAQSRLIELYSPYEMDIDQDDDSVYLNGELYTKGNVSGIVFTSYDIYSFEKESIKFYVFDSLEKE